ncbi:chaperone modulator CbpM [Thermodesulfobacteriota bacterium]
MSMYPLAIYCDHLEDHFERMTAARLARVSEEFINRCEREELVASRIMLHGKRGLCFADVCKLKIIRHLHEDMGLDLEAVDFVLRYRNRIKTMQRRLEQLEQHMRKKEQERLSEILALHRRLAEISADASGN